MTTPINNKHNNNKFNESNTNESLTHEGNTNECSKFSNNEGITNEYFNNEDNNTSRISKISPSPSTSSLSKKPSLSAKKHSSHSLKYQQQRNMNKSEKSERSKSMTCDSKNHSLADGKNSSIKPINFKPKNSLPLHNNLDIDDNDLLKRLGGDINNMNTSNYQLTSPKKDMNRTKGSIKNTEEKSSPKISRQSVASPKTKLRLSILERNLGRSQSLQNNVLNSSPTKGYEDQLEIKEVQLTQKSHKSNNSYISQKSMSLGPINEEDLIEDYNIMRDQETIKEAKSNNLKHFTTSNTNSYLRKFYNNHNNLGSLNKTFILNKKASLEKIYNLNKKKEEDQAKTPKRKKMIRKLSSSYISAKENYKRIDVKREYMDSANQKKINRKFSVEHITSRLGLNFV